MCFWVVVCWHLYRCGVHDKANIAARRAVRRGRCSGTRLLWVRAKRAKMKEQEVVCVRESLYGNAVCAAVKEQSALWKIVIHACLRLTVFLDKTHPLPVIILHFLPRGSDSSSISCIVCFSYVNPKQRTVWFFCHLTGSWLLQTSECSWGAAVVIKRLKKNQMNSIFVENSSAFTPTTYRHFILPWQLLVVT